MNKIKKQPKEWEKIFADDANDKGLISKKYTNSSYASIPTTKNNQKNGQKI